MRAWSAEDDDMLRMMAAVGSASFADVAKRIGRSRSAVAGRCDRLGISFGENAKAKQSVAAARNWEGHPERRKFYSLLHGKLSEAQVRAIRAEPLEYGAQSALARRYYVSITTISNICRGLTYRHVA